MAERKPIEELFDFEKGTLQSSKCTAGKYTFITAAEVWKTHKNFTHDCEALIFAMAASGSLGRTHYVKGKFISSDLCFILTPKKDLKLDLSFYHRLFNFLRQDIVKKTATGTSKLAINQTKFGAYKLPYFDYDHQVIFREKMETISGINEDFSNGMDHQLSFLNHLRQAVLQEAIEGKLTAEWRKHNPTEISGENHASKLLEKIKAEKERLIKEGKIKKDKPLAPIADAEKPFDLPDGWVWCKLGNLVQIKGGKRVANGYKLFKNHTPHIYIRVSDMKNGSIDDSDLHYIDEKMYQQIKQYTIRKDDLYMTIVGATIGKCGIVPDKFDNMNLTENAAKIILFMLNKIFLLYCLSSVFCQDQFIDKTKQVGVQKMALNRFSTTLISLPPFAEQQAIVERVEKLMAMIDELEKQVTARKNQAEMLMQSVLREAFEN